MMFPTLTIDEAAARARTSPENVRAALEGGDLRSLEVAHVDAWRRSLTAIGISRRWPT